MSRTMNNNNNNNKGNQVLNSGVGCSAERREKKYFIDLNEVYDSPDYSQVYIFSFYFNPTKNDQDYAFINCTLRES